MTPSFADLLHRLGEHLADALVTSGAMVPTFRTSETSSRRTGLGQALELGDDGVDGLVDAALDRDRIGTGGDVLEALVEDGLGEHRRGGGAVARDVVRLRGDFLTIWAPMFS